MRITPASNITLYRNVEIDNGEQLVFSSIEHQQAYFQSHRHPDGLYVPCTVVRKTGVLRVEKSMTTISECNYLSFPNTGGQGWLDGKTVYARIIDYDYVNNECTEVSYVIDYWQTWMFDVQFEDMYIERECLSEQDWGKANTNPYDPSIFEFRTDESLPVSKDLEKLNYEVGSDSTSDGYRITRALLSEVSVDGTMGVLIKLNNIDFESLDAMQTGAVTNYPSCQFANYLKDLLDYGLGFFSITKEMHDYLVAMHTAYPSNYPNLTGAYMIGAGWVDNQNNPIYPYKSSAYNPGCCLIYDPYGGDQAHDNGKMGKFLEMMTKWENIDKIIDMSIVPNNIMIFAGIPNAYAGGSPYRPSQVTPQISVTNKKLMRFPFSYLRVIAPNGDVKEYKYEFFKSIVNGSDNNRVASLIAILDMTDRPTLILAPQGYKYSGMSNSYGADANVEEAIYFDQFPTMPYSIDAFTAQIAAVANYTIGNKTVDMAADMAAADTLTNKTSQNITTIQNALGAASAGAGASKGVGAYPIYNDPSVGAESGMVGARLSGGGVGAGLGVANAAASAAGMYGTGATMAMNRKKFEAQAERWYNAELALGGADGGAIASQLRLTKSAYACDKYVPSNGIGVTNFNILGFCDLVFLRVSLSDEILALYDNYFTHYGYTSGRCGIPRVINYSKGLSDTDKVPHWLTINGKPSTYVKTMDCKIIHSMLPVASYIKAMFDSGVRMIKGDPS